MAAAARAQHAGRRLEAARAYARAAVAADRRVDRDEARYRQARVLIDAERRRDALALLDAIANTRPESRRTVRARYDAALLRLALGERDRALRELELVVRRYPGSGLAAQALRASLRELGGAEPSNGRADTLLASLVRDRRVMRSELGDNVLYEQARRAEAREDVAGARRALLELVARYPYPFGQLWDDALWNLARIEVAAGRPRVALEHLRRMVAVLERSDFNGSYVRPRMSAAQLRIGEILRDELHEPDAALEAFRALPSRFPDSIYRDDALLAAADILRGRRDLAGACALYRRVVREFERGRARRAARRALAEHCAAGAGALRD